MSLRDWVHHARETGTAGVKVVLPLALLMVVAFLVTWSFVEPAPPKRVVMAAGLPGGAYDRFARQYADFFKQNGFELEVRNTAGSIENYRLLMDRNSGVDVAIVQGGTMPEAAPETLQAVCSVYFEPFWVFYRSESIVSRLSQLTGKRIAIGAEGSGVRALATRLLQANGINPESPTPTVLMDLGGPAAAEALQAGQVDAVFLVISPDNEVVQQLLRTPGVRLMNFTQAEAYGRRFGFLSSAKLYQGVMDLGLDVPPRDYELIAPAAALITRKTASHGTVELLVQAAKKIHAQGTTLSAAEQFPSAKLTDLPVSSDAQYYLRTPPGRIWGRLPFWLKSLVDRMLILLIPLIAVMLPLMRFFPVIFRWSVRSRVVRYYARLRKVEEHLEQNPPRYVLEEDLKNLEALGHRLTTMVVPAGFMPDLYDLRVHLERVKEKARARLG